MAPSKRGISIPWNFSPADFSIYAHAIDSGKISWVSNWEMWKPEGLPANVLFIPQCRTALEADNIKNYLTGYENDKMVEDFIGFNEPDIVDQAHLSVARGVELWQQHVLPMKETCKGVKIGSPAVSNGPDGIQWLKDFFQQLGGIEKSGVDHIVVSHLFLLFIRLFTTRWKKYSNTCSRESRSTGTDQKRKHSKSMCKAFTRLSIYQSGSRKLLVPDGIQHTLLATKTFCSS
jgi:hypothetical protein